MPSFLSLGRLLSLGGCLSLLLFASLLPAGCSEPACAKRWRINCTCCANDSERQVCNKIVEEKYIQPLPLYPEQDQIDACVKYVRDFRCQDQLPTNIASFCTPS